jgi:hypothetical protein
MNGGQLKQVVATKQPWSVRVGAHYRASGLDNPEGIVWF